MRSRIDGLFRIRWVPRGVGRVYDPMTALKLGGLVLKEEQKAALYAVTLKKQD